MGRSGKKRQCPQCGSTDLLLQDSYDDGVELYVCSDCDNEFEVGGIREKHRRSEDDEEEVVGREAEDE